jgi:hypothetical protein
METLLPQSFRRPDLEKNGGIPIVRTANARQNEVIKLFEIRRVDYQSSVEAINFIGQRGTDTMLVKE